MNKENADANSFILCFAGFYLYFRFKAKAKKKYNEKYKLNDNERTKLDYRWFEYYSGFKVERPYE